MDIQNITGTWSSLSFKYHNKNCKPCEIVEIVSSLLFLINTYSQTGDKIETKNIIELKEYNIKQIYQKTATQHTKTKTNTR